MLCWLCQESHNKVYVFFWESQTLQRNTSQSPKNISHLWQEEISRMSAMYFNTITLGFWYIPQHCFFSFFFFFFFNLLSQQSSTVVPFLTGKLREINARKELRLALCPSRQEKPRNLGVTKRKEGSGKVNAYGLHEQSSCLRWDGLLLISYSMWVALYNVCWLKSGFTSQGPSE